MALLRKFFYKKPPDGLFEILNSMRIPNFDAEMTNNWSIGAPFTLVTGDGIDIVFFQIIYATVRWDILFESCFTTDVWEEEDYRVYVGSIRGQLQDHYPDASILVFNFGDGDRNSKAANVFSEYDMTIMSYPRHYEGCPLLSVELIHHFLRSSESWLAVGQQNVILMHCERGGWPVLAFMLAALLLYGKYYTGEFKTLDMIYKQAPRELLHLLSPLNPIPSQLRYLQYVSRRNVASQWPPLDRALMLDCVMMRMIPNFDGEGGCRPIFRIYGQDPLHVSDRTPKVLFSTPKRSKTVRHYKQLLSTKAEEMEWGYKNGYMQSGMDEEINVTAECQIVKIDINCQIQGDVVLECISLSDDMEREEMMFRVMFNTAFIRSNILMLNRDEIDILWDAKDQFPKEFRAEVLFSEMDAAACMVPVDLSCFGEKEGLPEEAFAKVQEIFSSVDWLVTKADAARDVIQQMTASPPRKETAALLHDLLPEKQLTKMSLAGPTLGKQSSSADTSKSKTEPQSAGRKSELSSAPPPPLLPPPPSSPLLQPSLRPPPSPPPPPPPTLPPHHLPASKFAFFSLNGECESGKSSSVPPSAIQTPPTGTVPKTLLSQLLPPRLQTQLLEKHAAAEPKPPPPPSTSPSPPPSAFRLKDPSPPLPQTRLPPTTLPLKEDKASRVVPSPPPPPPPPTPSNLSTPPLTDSAATETEPPPTPFPPLPPPPPPPPIPPLKNDTGTGFGSHPSQPPPPPPSPYLREKPAVSTGMPPPPPPPPTTQGESSVLGDGPPPPLQSGQSAQTTSSAPAPPALPPPGTSMGAVPPPPPPGPSMGAVPPPPPPGGNSSLSPPPPAVPPPGTKGRGLSRTIASRNNQIKKLKPLHWLKITRVVQGSLWAEAQKSGEASTAPEIDISELEALFSAAAPNAGRRGSSGKSNSRAALGQKSEKVQLIDHRRAYNCEIMLSKVKVPLPDLMASVLSLEDSALDEDQVDNLIKFCPTKEEMEMLKAYNGEKDKLGKCEQFFLELMQVPRTESKLRVFSFRIQFRSQIRSSTKLKKVMQTILSLGNALNQGTARGAAVGFRLDSLLKLTETRARNNKMTLMHYLCKVLADKLPDVLDFSKDLAGLEPASKIQLKFLAEEMQAINKGLEKVVQELSMAENDGPVSENFIKALKEFLSYAEGEVRSLASLYSGVGRNVDSLIVYFGEDPARCPFEQVVSTLLNFVRMFNKAHDENCKQLELEKKKAAKEEAENEKLLASQKKADQQPLASAVKSVK
ncbi:hypothetical protein LguiB_024393 [Lonicera macranthoides]